MADSYTQLAADSSGSKVQTFENTVGANVVEAQAITLIDATGLPDSYVQVAESTGNRIQHFQNTIGGSDVLALAVVLVAPTGTPL